MVIYKPEGKAGEYGKFAVNIYNGCQHGCKFCYVPQIARRTRQDFQAHVSPRKNILEDLEKDVLRHEGNGEPIFLSFMSDPYQPIEKELKLTRGVIEIIKGNGLNVRICTKSGLLVCRDFDLLGHGDFFGITITDPSSDYIEWEPYASPPGERMEALMEAHSQGINTWVSLEPVLNPDHAYEVIERTHAYVDEYKVGKLNHFPEIERKIDWKIFGEKVITMLEAYGKNYYIKEDLAKYLNVQRR